MTEPFASLDALTVRVPGGVADVDEPRAQAALEDASALIRATANVPTGQFWLDEGDEAADVPDIIVSITIAAARRALTNPAGLQQESVAGYSATFANASSDVYLTAAEKRLVRKTAGAGVGSIELESPYTPRPTPTTSEYVTVDGVDEPWIVL